MGDRQFFDSAVRDFDTQTGAGEGRGLTGVIEGQRLPHQIPTQKESGERTFHIDQVRETRGKMATRGREDAGLAHVTSQLAPYPGLLGHLPDAAGDRQTTAF